MRITNQKPQVLSPVYNHNAAGVFDPVAHIREILADPLYTPLSQNHTVSIDDKGTPVTPDIIANNIVNCCSIVQNPASETWCKELYSMSLVSFDKNTPLNIKNLFAIQSGKAVNLPPPSVQVIYTPANDIIPACKHFMTGQCTYDDLFASFAFYTRAETLGFFFVNEVAFNDFKTWFEVQTTLMTSVYPVETNQLIGQFIKEIELKELTESLSLRNNDSENNNEYSFARVLIEHLMKYTNVVSPSEFGVMPFDLGELFCPKSVVFINLERHSHASAKKISDEWQIINNSTSMGIQMISNGKLSKLTAAARNLKHIQAAAANALSNMNQMAVRAASLKFRPTAPNIVDITHYLVKILSKMSRVFRSENSYHAVRMTFSKPNRRNPDDFNKQGKSVSTRYKPDIHIYLDTSGSISEENYQSAVQACIKLAKKLNINVYFNSFSHILSQCTKLNTKDKTTSAIYKQFQKTPKVSGGTNYEQIWKYINKSAKRKRELSLIITDFEYTAPNSYTPHPKNLYYIPCAHCNWNSIVYYATEFCKSMRHIDPDARRHILF